VRLGAACVRVVEADAASADLGGGYDRILVDPPCSDLGALASRPDARWRKSPQLIERLARIQEAILGRAAIALRPGGRLVYATCTISARENEERIAALCERDRALVADDLGAVHPELASRRQPSSLQTRPDRDRTDGFFIARLRRDTAEPGSAGER
jgi:16S rRNA (cytosine967-C5)-methyltransferase